MKFKNNFLFNYSKKAPLALAVERSLECDIMSKQKFIPPILDIGCGDGLFAFILFDQKIDVGVDPDKRALWQAKKYGVYKELIQCPGNNIPKEARLFNTIFSNSVLEHTYEPQSLIKEAYRLLASDGQFFVTVPTEKFDKFTIVYQFLSFCRLDNFAKKYNRFFNKFWKHYHHYSKEDWQKLFTKYGFRVIKSQEYDSKIICLINDFLAPFGLFSFLMKKLYNRWIIFEKLRKIYIFPVFLLLRYLVNSFANDKPAGLVFFHLNK